MVDYERIVVVMTQCVCRWCHYERISNSHERLTKIIDTWTNVLRSVLTIAHSQSFYHPSLVICSIILRLSVLTLFDTIKRAQIATLLFLTPRLSSRSLSLSLSTPDASSLIRIISCITTIIKFTLHQRRPYN